MKKIMIVLVIAILTAAMTVPAFAETDFSVPCKTDKDSAHIKIISYDNILPDISCKEHDNIYFPVVTADKTEVTLWGWIGTDIEVKAFSYSVNGGEVKTDEKWKFETEKGVVDAAKSVGAEYGQRFRISVPVSAGTQVIRAYAEFVDGTHELFWVTELTVGDKTDFNDAGDTYTVKPSDDNDDDDKQDPPTTGGDTKAETDFSVPWQTDKASAHIKRVSYDNIAGLSCKEGNNKTYPVVAADKTEGALWGWIATDIEVKAFSYSVNGGEVKTSEKWMAQTEQGVVDAAKSIGAEYGQRFSIPVPVTAGTQVIRAYAEFVDGTHELFWVVELTVGDKSDFNDAGDTYTVKPSDDNDDGGNDNEGDGNNDGGNENDNNDRQDPPATGDTKVVFAAAAAGILLTALIKRKVNA